MSGACTTPLHVEAPRDSLLAALQAATQRDSRRDPDVALHAFLNLISGYYLGEWLPPHKHFLLVERRAAALDGLADLIPPADPVHATQLAQHVGELAAEFGPTPWITRLARATAGCVPDWREDWDAGIRAGAQMFLATGDGHPLLRAHARRRLWELTQPADPAGHPCPSPLDLTHFALAAAAMGDGHGLQLMEAVLAEISSAGELVGDLLPVLRLALPSVSGRAST